MNLLASITSVMLIVILFVVVLSFLLLNYQYMQCLKQGNTDDELNKTWTTIKRFVMAFCVHEIVLIIIVIILGVNYV